MTIDLQDYLDSLPEDQRRAIADRAKELIREDTAFDLLRRLTKDGCYRTSGIHDDPGCYFCWEDWDDFDRERHKPDCPYVAAKAFLESLED